MTTLLTEELWAGIESLLPRHKPSPEGGAPRRSDRACLEGILYVLKGGIPWRMLPAEFGVSATTCWRRFQEWTKIGVWDQLHRKLLSLLGKRGKLQTKRVVIDSASVRALKGGRTRGLIQPTGRNQGASGM